MAPLKTPDFTPPAIAGAVITLLINLLLLFGLNLSDPKKAALSTVVDTGFIVGLFVHDAIVRHGRAVGLGGAVSKLVAAAAADVPAFTHNPDGSWTRTEDGARGNFGPHGFVPAAKVP